MKALPLPPQEELHKLFTYNPDSGVIKWCIKPGKNLAAGSIAGTIQNKGYRVIAIARKRYMAHRIIWMYMTGEDPRELEVDHLNNNRLDNRWINLRLLEGRANHRKQLKPIHNTSGYKGVTWCKAANKWMAQIQHSKKHTYLGLYSCAKEAALAYDVAARRYHGEHIRLNFPKPTELAA